EVEFLNNMIREIVSPLRVRCEIIIWLHSHIDLMSESDVKFWHELWIDMRMYAFRLVDEGLPTLIVDKSPALTVKQKLKLREIVKLTRLIDGFKEISELTVFYENSWLPAIG